MFDVPKYLLTQNAWQVKTKMNRHIYLLKKGKNYNAYQIISLIYWLLILLLTDANFEKESRAFTEWIVKNEKR